MQGKRILLIIGGGIAAYKALELIRRLREQGAHVTCILTAGGQQFVTPLSVAALSEHPVYSDLFDLKDETEMGHIQLSRNADLLVVCPATADLMAKMATGLANDLASTVLLATDKPVLVIPAMNVRMWQHPATQRNVAQIQQDGVMIMPPDEGVMACGEFGPGRLPEIPAIVERMRQSFLSGGRLAGLKILVTAGPTHEPIDPVRYIANRSSGKQGYAIAGALAALGADVTLVSGPTALPTPAGVARLNVETAQEMLAACQQQLPVDAAVCVAAVADWRVDAATHKIKKNNPEASPALTLIENPDILAQLSRAAPERPRLVVGFAAETNNIADFAQQKRSKKGCDWIIANDVSPENCVMGGDKNTVHLVTPAGIESWPTLTKIEVAHKLAERIADALQR